VLLAKKNTKFGMETAAGFPEGRLLLFRTLNAA